MRGIFFVLNLLLFFSAYAASSDLVDVATVNAGIKLDIRYATNNNFTGKKIYDKARCFLLRFVAEKLDHVHKKLAKRGLGLKVFDGYRPLAAQRKMWVLVPDERYVSNPAKGGRHTRGTTVDVTLVTLADGKEVEMPTPFDDFTERAHADTTEGISPKAIANRSLLRSLMEAEGFIALPTEWWHFDVKDWLAYAPLDLSFEEIDQQQAACKK